MPITYTVDLERGISEARWTGRITVDDVRDHWTRLLADPDALRFRRSLADIREADFELRGPELDALVRTLMAPALEGRSWKAAIIVEKPVQMGLSRQYQVFAERYSVDAIFTDPDAARAWLLSPSDAP